MLSKDATVGVGAHWSSVRLAQGRISALSIISLDKPHRIELSFYSTGINSIISVVHIMPPVWLAVLNPMEWLTVHRQLIPVYQSH